MSYFKPFYISAQALDNISDDLMYEVRYQPNSTKKAVVETVGQSKAQDIKLKEYKMVSKSFSLSDVDNLLKNLLKKVAFDKRKLGEMINIQQVMDNLDVIVKGKNVLISLKSQDKDNINRMSPIGILLDLEGVSKANYQAYIGYFEEGLLAFLEQTGRKPKSSIREINQAMLSLFNIIEQKTEMVEKIRLALIAFLVLIFCIIVYSLFLK